MLIIVFRYEEAEEELNHQFELVNNDGQTSNLGRVAVELFLLQLAKDDFVAASKVLNGYGMQYCTQEEVYIYTILYSCYNIFFIFICY